MDYRVFNIVVFAVINRRTKCVGGGGGGGAGRGGGGGGRVVQSRCTSVCPLYGRCAHPTVSEMYTLGGRGAIWRLTKNDSESRQYIFIWTP